jgi:hypothetical protein
VVHERDPARTARVVKTMGWYGCAGDEQRQTDDSFHSHVVVLRPFEPRMSYDGRTLGVGLTAAGGAYLPCGHGSRLMQVS